MERERVWERLKWVIIGLHFCLALAFNFATPYRTAGYSQGVYLADMGAPDELAHSKYVEHLLRERSLPVLVPGDDANFQSHQAPLFYIMDAAWVRAAGFENLESEASGRWARTLNSLFGALFVWGTFSLARRLTARSDLALAAAAIVAFLPMNLALSGALSNDPLLFALCTWSIAFSVGAENKRDLWLAGLCAGLALWTKSSALALVPALMICVWRDRRAALPLLAVPSVMGSVWWLHNIQVYGNPLAHNAFLARFQPDAPEIHGLTDLARWLYAVLRPSLQSLVGQFGYMDIATPMPLVVLVLGMMVILGILSARQRERDPQNLPLVVFSFTVVAMYLVFNRTYFQPQARYCFAALAPLAYFLCRPIGNVRRWVWMLPAVLLLTSIVNLARLPGEFRLREQQLEQARSQGLVEDR